MKDQHQPPRWARALFAWYCKSELYEDLIGDLTEYFHRNVAKRGPRYARLVFVIDTLKFFRLYTIRKPSFVSFLTHRLMIGSYIKTSVRNTTRNKMFSAINIVGLAVSMTVALMLISVLIDMFQYDRFHANNDRIYRVIADRGDNTPYASTSLKAAEEITRSVPGIEKVAVFRWGVTGDFTFDQTTVPLTGMWANPSVLDVFNFPLISGNPAKALSNPYSIIVTETAAAKLFGKTDPMGKVVSLRIGNIHGDLEGKHEFTITGVMKDVPKFSHVRFELLGSLNTVEMMNPDNTRLMKWDSMWDTYTYLLLQPDVNMVTLQESFNAICKEQNQTIKSGDISLSLQPLTSIALGDDLNNSIGPVMGKSDVWMMGVLALIVLISACFNYMNLSIAKALNRAREIGVRKVIGATRKHVMAQLIVEAIFISTLSLVVAFGLFMLIKPAFLRLNPDLADMITMSLSAEVLFWFVMLAVTTGIVAGFVPAIFFSRLNAVNVLKNTKAIGGFHNINLRKALIVVQYSVSIAFIAATLIGLRQYEHLLSFDLGYRTQGIFNLNLRSNAADLLKKEIAEIPEVKGISSSSIITSVGNYWGSKIKYKPGGDSTWANYNQVDENYLPLHDHHLIAGHNFTMRAPDAPESEVIVSTSILKRFNIAGGDPIGAVGETVFVDGTEMKIVGVMEDFHYGKADNRDELVIFRQSNGKPRWLNIDVATDNWPETLAKIEMAWRKIDKAHPMEGDLYDDQIKNSYEGISAMLTLIGALAFLAICISSLGLFGMVVFTTEGRLREVSIRKVMGADEWKLIYLMGKGFLTLLGVATCIAVPVTYIFFDQVALPELVNPAPIGFLDLFGGLFVILIIALGMIGTQTFKVARTNPADVLRAE